jgi:transposase
MGIPTPPSQEDLDVPDGTFARPALTSFCRLDELGLEVVGQQLQPDRAVLACRVTGADRWCRRCGCEGSARDTVVRRLAHEPLGWRPTTLLVRVVRYRCGGCGRVWRQDTSRAAEPRARLSRRALRWALEASVCQHLTVARVAEALAVSWDTANDAVLAEGRRVLIADPDRLAEVRVIGVDEHAWRHTRKGDKYVTVIIDLTAVPAGTGLARLLDMVEGRSKQVFTDWREAQSAEFRGGIEVVAMDGFTGFKTATSEQLPDAVAAMDPFHVAALAGDALDRCRQRVNSRPVGIEAGPATRSTASAGCGAPAPSCSLTDNRSGSTRSSPTRRTSKSRPPGASTNASSPPTATPTAPPRRETSRTSSTRSARRSRHRSPS